MRCSGISWTPPAGISAPPGACANAGGDVDLRQVAQSLLRVILVMRRYVQGAGPGWIPEPRRGRRVLTGWARAGAEAREALSHAMGFLYEPDAARRQPQAAARGTLAWHLDGVAASLAAGRDLLHTHLATDPRGERELHSEWALTVTSPASGSSSMPPPAPAAAHPPRRHRAEQVRWQRGAGQPRARVRRSPRLRPPLRPTIRPTRTPASRTIGPCSSLAAIRPAIRGPRDPPSRHVANRFKLLRSAGAPWLRELHCQLCGEPGCCDRPALVGRHVDPFRQPRHPGADHRPGGGCIGAAPTRRQPDHHQPETQHGLGPLVRDPGEDRR